MQAADIDILCNNHILGFYETWANEEINISSFRRYSKIVSNATRIHSVGRYSAGLVLYYRNDVIKLKKIIRLHDHFIATRLSYQDINIILILVYIPPKPEHDKTLELLSVLLDEIDKTYQNDLLVVTGDFNSRVAECDTMSTSFVANWGKNEDIRCSNDKKLSNRGEKLLELMNDYNMVLMNGRTKSDTPANFTFSGMQGQSVIDLFFIKSCDVEKCEDIHVKNIPYSSHFPVQMSIEVKIEQTETCEMRMIWDDSKDEQFKKNVVNLINHQPQMTYDTFCDIIYQAAITCGMVKKCKIDKKVNKPWFDNECKEKLNLVKKSYKNAKNCSSDVLWKFYNSTKKDYSGLIKSKRQKYENQIRIDLGNCTDNISFWKAVKKFRRTTNTPCQVDNESWIEFHKNILPQRSISTKKYYGNECHELDKEITKTELTNILNSIPNGKAVGTDCISNEFLKHLPDLGKDWLVEILNYILVSEKTPLEWASSATIMLFKKGDPMNPANYRPITLLNHLYKLFAQVIQNRLYKWADENGLLPESQAGFRKERSCEDQIFCLNAAIQINLSKNKGKVYALFIDFARAFSSIPHEKLWDKLLWLGVSSKIIRILKNLYDNFNTAIKTEHGYTEQIEITEGLGQGCILSPLLFNLYICDIESFLYSTNLFGVKISHDFQLQILSFADDMTVLGSTPGELQRKINRLYEYFENLSLIVNIDKTKIVIFRKGGNRGKNLTFWYGDKQIEIVSKYTYLGVPFYSTGVYCNTAKHFTDKGKAALGMLWKVICGGKMRSWSGRLKLFNSIVTSTTLYGSHIWGLLHVDQIEKIQSYFLKRVIGVSKYTSNSVLRLETGRTHLKFSVIKKAVVYWAKMLNMENDRYVKKCFLALNELSLTSKNLKYNWVSQMKQIFDTYGFSCLGNENNYIFFSSNIGSLLKAVIDIERQNDVTRVQSSNRYSHYTNLIPETPLAVKYICMRLPYRSVSLIAQLRFKQESIYFDRQIHVFDPSANCKICNKLDSIDHFITECIPIKTFNAIRQDMEISGQSWLTILNQGDDKITSKFFYSASASLRLRKFILDCFEH